MSGSFLLSLVEQYGARLALLFVGTLGVVDALRVLALGDVSEFDVLASSVPDGEQRSFKHLVHLSMDFGLPYAALVIYVALRGSKNFVTALCAAFALFGAVDLKALSLVAALSAAGKTWALGQSRFVVAALVAFGLLFVCAPALKRVQRASSLERRVLHLLGYASVLYTVLVWSGALTQHSLIGHLAAPSAALVATHVSLLTFVSLEAVLLLAAVHYADEEELLAFFLTAFSRLLFTGVTHAMALDYAGAANTRLLVFNALLALPFLYFVVKRVRDDKKRK